MSRKVAEIINIKMEFEQYLKNWQEYFCKTRQIGHTYTCLNGVSNVENSLIVVPFKNQQKQFQKNKSICFVDKLDNIKQPVVFDNFTVIMLIEKSLSDRISKSKIKATIEKLEDKYDIIENECTLTYDNASVNAKKLAKIQVLEELKQELNIKE